MTAEVAFGRVTFEYPGAARPALAEVTLDVPEGVFALVVGRTGAGKSTLLRAVNGLVPHFTGGTFSGRVRIGGRDTTTSRPRDLADVVGYVPQDPEAAFVLDRVEDEIAYGMENLGVAAGAMRRRVEEMLDLLALAPLRARRLRDLSGGERQRVAIAAALAPGPRVLVLDEPTSQLDPQGAEDVLAALQRMVHDLGLTVLAAEHRLERVAGFADLAIVCEEGRASAGDPAAGLEHLDVGPPVARLGRLLGWSPVPLTVRDARARAGRLRLVDPVPPGRPSPGEALVRTRGLEAGWGPTRVLRGVDLDVRAGEVVALMGRNGAGKTTLLRAISGLHPPSAGSVASGGGRSPRIGEDVALCPQDPSSALFCERVEDEVRASLSVGGRGGDPREVLRLVGIDDLAGRHPRDCSVGQRMLVAVAAVVATGAPVLLLDEPTRGLDADAKARFAGFLRRFADEGGAVLFATHDVELSSAVAGRVLMLAGGEIIDDGVPERVLADSPVFAPQMSRVFGPGWLTPQQVFAAVVPA
ncbi:MAG: ABC transporter ATP-binding protein [Actinomycetota bacterium]